MRLKRFLVATLLVLGVCFALPAQAQTKVAFVGEQTTHSVHRENDPEYPELIGPLLDSDFKKDTTKTHPDGGGFIYGAGTSYSIGNFGVAKGSVLTLATAGVVDPVITSNELIQAQQFSPGVVVLGPFGYHEALSSRAISNFSADFRLLIAKIQGFASKPAILIATPIPRDAAATDAIYAQVNTQSRAVAAELGLRVIDLWPVFLNKKAQYFTDATHLNLAGRQLLAQTISAGIKEWKAAAGSGGTGGSAGAAGSGGAAGGGSGGTGGSGGIMAAGGSSTAGSAGNGAAGNTTAGGGGGGAGGLAGSGGGGASAAGTSSTGGAATPTSGGAPGGAGMSSASGGSTLGGAPSPSAGGAPQKAGAGAGGAGAPAQPADPTSASSGCSVHQMPSTSRSAFAGALLSLTVAAFASRRRRRR